MVSKLARCGTVQYSVCHTCGVISNEGAYLPVIILHGIFSGNDSMSDLASMVTTAHPGTKIHNIDGYDGIESMDNLWSQVNKFRKKMMPIFENSPDGVNMICFSQGIVNFHCGISVVFTSCGDTLSLCWHLVVVLAPCTLLLCCHFVLAPCCCVVTLLLTSCFLLPCAVTITLSPSVNMTCYLMPLAHCLVITWSSPATHICHTGALACRAILETTPQHNVKTFVSLSGPQGGQFGGEGLL